jgi:hypothetical protein
MKTYSVYCYIYSTVLFTNHGGKSFLSIVKTLFTVKIQEVGVFCSIFLISVIRLLLYVHR